MKNSYNNPKAYFEEVDRVFDNCQSDLMNLIQEKFKGHYQRKDDHEFIKLHSILGVPCITELKVDEDILKYRSGVWGRNYLINTEGSWYTLPRQEIISVYDSLYNIVMGEK